METRSDYARVQLAPPPSTPTDLCVGVSPSDQEEQADFFQTPDNQHGSWLASPSTPTAEYQQHGQDQPASSELVNPTTDGGSSKQPRPPVLQKLKTSWLRLRVSISWLTIYFGINCCGFILRFSCYPQDSAVWFWPGVAKGSAECALINAVLALLFICYHSVTRVRMLLFGSKRSSSASGHVSSILNTPIEKHVAFHKLAGAVVLTASIVHSLAWFCILFLIRTCSQEDWALSAYHHHQIIREAPLTELLVQLPIWTGLLMLLCVLVATPFCFPCARDRSYRTFLIVHMAFLPFIGLLLIHGAAGWMGALQAPYWLLFPLILYLRECRQRRKIAFTETRVVNFEVQSDAVLLKLTKPAAFKTKLKPGMVPSISRLEWHPFSVSSAPQDEFVQLHIAQVGDWTRSLAAQLTREKTALAVRVNGPIGTSAALFVRYRAVVFVAAGIGVTPFLSLLRCILHTWRQQLFHPPAVGVDNRILPEKVVFVWSTRKEHQLQWILTILDEFQDVLSHAKYKRAIEIHLHLTSSLGSGDDDTLEASHACQVRHRSSSRFAGVNDSVCMMVELHRTRPDWRQLFVNVGAQYGSSFDHQHHGERVAVFVCANKRLTKRVKSHVAALNASPDRNGPRLDVFAE